MARFKENIERLYSGVFVCRKCKTKIRADPLKVRLKKVKCRRCDSKALRVKHREVKK
mgnify:CR=1 FL=1